MKKVDAHRFQGLRKQGLSFGHSGILKVWRTAAIKTVAEACFTYFPEPASGSICGCLALDRLMHNPLLGVVSFCLASGSPLKSECRQNNCGIEA